MECFVLAVFSPGRCCWCQTNVVQFISRLLVWQVFQTGSAKVTLGPVTLPTPACLDTRAMMACWRMTLSEGMQRLQGVCVCWSCVWLCPVTVINGFVLRWGQRWEECCGGGGWDWTSMLMRSLTWDKTRTTAMHFLFSLIAFNPSSSPSLRPSSFVPRIPVSLSCPPFFGRGWPHAVWF